MFKAENVCDAVKTQDENISCVYMGDIRGCESHIWQQPYAYICNDESGTYISPLYGDYISFANAILIRRLDRIKTVIQLHVQINMMQDH